MPPFVDKIEKFKSSPETDVFKCPIFKVKSQTVHSRDGSEHLDVYTLTCAHWVNVIPVLPDGRIVLVEQHRFGVDTSVFEVPGGSVSKGEKDFTLSAIRELEEETGLTSKRIISLPGFYPNPAIMQNRVTYFIAFDCSPVQTPVQHDDKFEEIKLHFVTKEEVYAMVRSGQISHALSALGLLLAQPYLLK